MITFKRRTLWDKIECLYPPHKQQADARIEAAIDALMKNPTLPCNIEGEVIQNGYDGQNFLGL